MLQRISILMTGLLLLLIVVGVGVAVSERSRPIDIRFAVTSHPIAGLAYVADTKNYFKDHGLRVSLLRVDEADQAAMLVTNNEVDAAIVSLAEPLRQSPGASDFVVVAAIDYSAGADGIVAIKDITSVEALAHRRVGVSPSGLSLFLLAEALQRAGLSLANVTVVPAAPLEGVREFLADKVDAVTLEEPYLSFARGRSDSQLLFSSAAMPGLLPNVLVFRRSFIEAHPERVKSFLGAWFEMADHFTRHPHEQPEILSVVAMARGMSLDQVQESFRGSTLLTRADNAAAFTYGPDLTSLYGATSRLGQFFVTQGMLSVVPPLDQVLEPAFIIGERMP